MNKLHAFWFQNCKDADDKLQTERAIRSSTVVLDGLQAFVEQELAKLEVPSTEEYGYAAWPYLMADQTGQKRVYKKLLELLKL